MRHEQVNAKQVLLLLASLRMTTGAISLPVVSMGGKGPDAWLVPILAGFAAAVPVMILLALQSHFPRESLVQYARRLAGPWLSALFVLPVLLFFLFRAALALRQYADLMTSGPMPETPDELFVVLVALCGAIIVRLGLEPGARVMEGAVPMALAALIGLLLLGMKEMDPKALKPMLGEGWGPVLSMVPSITALYIADTFPLVMLGPRLSQPGLLKGAVLGALAVSSAFIALSAAGVVMFFSAGEARVQTFPIFSLARAISLADIIERLDAFYLLVITVMTTGQIIVLFYSMAAGLAQWADLRDYRPLVMPVALVSSVFALLIYESRAEIADYLEPWAISSILLPPTLGIGCVLLGLAWLRKSRGKAT